MLQASQNSMRVVVEHVAARQPWPSHWQNSLDKSIVSWSTNELVVVNLLVVLGSCQSPNTPPPGVLIVAESVGQQDVSNWFDCRYRFMVHPSGFIIHRQHARSHADKMYQTQKVGYEAGIRANKEVPKQPDSNLAVLTHKFRDLVQAQLLNATYQPLVDKGIRDCLQALPWWRQEAQT
jgi:hypothetical protein